MDAKDQNQPSYVIRATSEGDLPAIEAGWASAVPDGFPLGTFERPQRDVALPSPEEGLARVASRPPGRPHATTAPASDPLPRRAGTPCRRPRPQRAHPQRRVQHLPLPHAGSTAPRPWRLTWARLFARVFLADALQCATGPGGTMPALAETTLPGRPCRPLRRRSPPPKPPLNRAEPKPDPVPGPKPAHRLAPAAGPGP